MTRWNCKYSTHFCGHFGDLCEKCDADVKAERAAKNAAPVTVLPSTGGSLDLRSLTTEQLRGLKDGIEGLLHTRERYPGSCNHVSVEVSIGGLRIKF